MNGRFLAFLGFVVASLPATAFAEETRTSWWLEGRPWPCTSLVAPLAEELALLCDASGARCSIARNQAQATRRAVLYCERADAPGTKNEAWVLEAQDEKGERLWSVNLAGEEPERLHQGAMWIARAEGGEPVAPPHAPVVKLGQGPVKDAVSEKRKGNEPSGGLAFSSRGSVEPYAYAESAAGFSIGGRIDAAGRVAGATRAKVFADATLPTQHNIDVFRRMRAGFGAAWGAPWTDDVLGADIAAGAAAVVNERKNNAYYEEHIVPFGEARVVAQIPTGTVRPFVAAGLSIYGPIPLSDGKLPLLSAGLDAGLAWSAW